MKGCLSFIIKTVIAVLVFFGLLHLGVIDYVRDKINEYNNPSQDKMIEKTKDILDFSAIGEEYSIDKNMKLLKNRMIIAEHNASGQKMIMIVPKDGAILTKENIKSDKLQEKVNEAINKYKYKVVRIDKAEVVKRGEFKGIEQQIPYARINAVISSLPVKDMDGILGVAELKDGQSLIVISINEKGKYSQIITEAFYGQVK